MSDSHRNWQRLLMISPSPRDERILGKVFREDRIDYQYCRDIRELCAEMDRGCGLVIVPEASAKRMNLAPLVDRLRRQEPWSDVPVIFIPGTEEAPSPDLYGVGNATVIRPPLQIVTLLSVIHSGLASRRKQLQLRDMLQKEEQARKRLEEADRRKDEFLATLAHELRNPIAPIQNALDLIELSEAPLHSDAELRRIMSRQVQQLKRIVDDLLDVSRITRGKVGLVLEHFDLREAIRAGIESAKPFIENSNQSLHVDLGAEPLPVRGDRTRLAQVTANLLNNAAKYTPAAGNIWVTACRDRNELTLEVRDDGIGISDAELDSIFELFTQHDIERERGQAGLGIGLTLVRQLLDLHEGSIEAQSDGRSKGSTFTVRLALASPSALEGSSDCRDDHERSKAPEAQTIQHRILVVEDTPAIRFVLKRLLEKLGHEVAVAEDGEQGLRLAGDWNPTVVISDIAMPRMNGYRLAERLRADTRFDGITLAAMTGYGRDQDRRKALENGFDHHLTKPVDINELRQLLSSVASDLTEFR